VSASTGYVCSKTIKITLVGSKKSIMKKHRYVLWVRFVVVSRILCEPSINSSDSLRTIMDENTCALGIGLILR
jgi:hypothetical protein